MAQTPPACPEVPFQPVRYLEDYSVWASPACRRGLFAIKYVPLGGAAYASFGGQARVRWERWQNELFGRLPQDDDGQLALRALLYGDLELGPTVRAFVELQAATVAGRLAPPTPLDRDLLDVHQAFLEAHAALGAARVTARVGRQEAVRDFRLLGIRDYPNLRLSFDGAKLDYVRPGVSLSVYGAEAVRTREGVFDDGWVGARETVWGGHALFAWDGPLVNGLSLFYVGYDAERAVYAEGVGPERRHSLGVHAWYQSADYHYSLEAIGQSGSFAERDIRAWLLAADAGLALHAAEVRFEPLLIIELASGDRRPGDGRLQTFDALFPQNRYFGSTGVIGAFSNSLHASPRLDVFFGRALRTTGFVELFWRESTHDAVYAPARFPSVPLTGSRARFVGTQLGLELELYASRSLAFEARQALFLGGPLIAHSDGSSQTVAYTALQASWRF
jgi:hypothetical protein